MTRATGGSIRTGLVWTLAGCLLAGCARAPADIGYGMTKDSPMEEEPRPAAAPEPRIIPIPPIPVALRGCWETDGPSDPEEPGGPHRLVITATTIEERWEGQPARVATAEYVREVSSTSIDGLFSAPDNGNRATVATSLMLGDGVDWSADTLRRAEGDAGSDYYRRCAQ
jgi:hypothetical protein